MINFHDLSGLKPHIFAFLKVWRQTSDLTCVSWGSDQVLAGLCSFWSLQKRSHFLAFPSFQRPPEFLGAWPLSPPSKAATSPGLPHTVISLVLFHLPLPQLRTLVITLGPSGKFKVVSLSQGELTSNLNSFLKKKILFIYLQREGKGGRETSMCDCLSHTLHWGPGPQPRHVPCLGNEQWPFSSQASTPSTEPHQPGRQP